MITSIGHVAFRVTSLQRALDFYCNKLGFSEVFRLDQEGQPSPWIVYIQIVPGTFIELFPDAEDAPGAIRTLDPQPGYQHICLLVDDMAATLNELASRGLEITQAPTVGLDHNLQYWVNDPDGHPIELMQIAPDSPQAAADRSRQ